MTKKRVLFFAETVSLAHATRPLVLATELSKGHEEIYFAAGPHPEFISRELAKTGLKPIPLQSCIPEKEFASALKNGTLPYTVENLERAITEDLHLIDELRPDCVVGDFRLSLGVSAAIRKVPYVNLTNLIWSPKVHQKLVLPDHPTVRILGPQIMSVLGLPVKWASFRILARSFDKVRRHYGLPPYGNLSEVYTQGDRVLYLDLPELYRFDPLPAGHQIIGPLLYSADIPMPPGIEALPKDRPWVLISLGSSGDTRILSGVLEGLSEMPVVVLMATAGRLDARPISGKAQFHVMPYLPFAKIMPSCAFCITNGGTPMNYLALAAGVPVLGLPSNLDQCFSMNSIVEQGAGLLVRAGQASPSAVRTAATRFLEDPSLRSKARDLSRLVAKYDAPRTFCEFLRKEVLT